MDRPRSESKHPPLHWGILFFGILALSTGSTLVRLAGAPPLVIGAWRMLLATALITPWALPRVRREWAALTRKEVLLLCLAGVALAIHFATWISSLSYTTVTSSVVLVSTNPIFVGLATHYILKERLNWRAVSAIAVTLVGTAIVSYGDLALSGDALWGDALALMGAVSASAYLLLGRAVRRKLSTLAYVWPCYGIAGLILLLLCLATRQPLLGYDGRTYLVFWLLAIAPQILGHSAFNWALAHFTPVFVTLAILGEPIGATILAWLVLQEAPPLTALLGGVLIMAGIYAASRAEAAAS